MTTKYQILQLLEESGGRLISGGEIAQHLSISRTAVWKALFNRKVTRLRRNPVKGICWEKAT